MAIPTTKLEWALNLAGRGIKVHPVDHTKHPATRHGFLDATTDRAMIMAWWSLSPDHLVSIPTGGTSGIDVLDIDGPKHPEAAEWFKQRSARLPKTRVHQTRSGGLHILFRHDRPMRCGAGVYTDKDVTPGIDIKADGGAIIFWPASGFPVLDDSPIVDWPAWLRREVTYRPPAPKIDLDMSLPPDEMARDLIDRAMAEVMRAPIGTRNHTLNRAAFFLARKLSSLRLSSRREAEAMLLASGMAAGLNQHEVRQTTASGISKGWV